MDPNTVMYRVQAWCPVLEGTQGGQFSGSTVVEPGQAGSEYFMTHGHFHLKRDRTEYYGTIEGDGTLILMDGNRKTWMERMSDRSLHFVPPNTAHRVANIGKVPLRLVACWPSNAGHDYESVRRHGFGARLRNIHGEPKLLGAARNFPFAQILRLSIGIQYWTRKTSWISTTSYFACFCNPLATLYLITQAAPT